MTRPMPPDQFRRLARTLRGEIVDGLPAAIDLVAEAAAPTHGFLRYQWYAAALRAYGGAARTLTVSAAEVAMLALPMIAVGPARLRLATVPGSYWPFRGFPLAVDAGAEVLEQALDTLARGVNALRIGPVADDDPAASALIAAARARGWGVAMRTLGQGWLLDMAALQAEGAWPRTSTLRKNRYHEKQLAEHGALDWRFLSNLDWPAAFDALATIEQASWIMARTDGSDAKFTERGHGLFWRTAATDPVLAGMMRAALLSVDGRPAAFSFDLDAGTLKYAVANSYDPAYAKHSPGKLLYYRNLIDASSRGITIVDWGMGDSGYKQVIGATPGPMLRDWLLLRPGLPARLAPLISRVWRGR
ncbi:GNAT family N-acetyltransferase [Sphingomonas lycopersici]|uniref:GNAT family N-acetyltransferase n=1 Tax=Sphingomonas lycopersici TaxID=2951807 RepID=A0AA41ZAQ2_9SPHN|nr:GNAT family N-acetyltransferase [Sphingomonas lycopersici]MCW6535726.1 GNAT family N-acetyltransferase [Sphingomonas lycopersici]